MRHTASATAMAGDLPAGEHKISQGDLLVYALINKALVDALIVTADQNEMVIVCGQALGVGLPEGVCRRGT